MKTSGAVLLLFGFLVLQWLAYLGGKNQTLKDMRRAYRLTVATTGPGGGSLIDVPFDYKLGPSERFVDTVKMREESRHQQCLEELKDRHEYGIRIEREEKKAKAAYQRTHKVPKDVIVIFDASGGNTWPIPAECSQEWLDYNEGRLKF